MFNQPLRLALAIYILATLMLFPPTLHAATAYIFGFSIKSLQITTFRMAAGHARWATIAADFSRGDRLN